MRITRSQSHLVRLPADDPLAGGAPFPAPFREFVTLEVATPVLSHCIQGPHFGYLWDGERITTVVRKTIERSF